MENKGMPALSLGLCGHCIYASFISVLYKMLLTTQYIFFTETQSRLHILNQYRQYDETSNNLIRTSQDQYYRSQNKQRMLYVWQSAETIQNMILHQQYNNQWYNNRVICAGNGNILYTVVQSMISLPLQSGFLNDSVIV